MVDNISNGELSTSTIVGIALGGVVCIGVIVFLIWLYKRKPDRPLTLQEAQTLKTNLIKARKAGMI